MKGNEKEIVDEEDFSFNGVAYTARLYHPAVNQNYIYGEIVFKGTEERPYGKMRKIAREYLLPYGEKIPTTAKRLVTHEAVKKMIEFIRSNKK